MQKKVLFAGDINVDIIMNGLYSNPVPDKEVSCKEYYVTAGSSAFICGAAFSFLGGKASMTGLCGKDGNGEFMMKALKQFKIGTELVERTDKVATGVTVNLIKDSVRTQITYLGTIAAFNGKLFNKKTLSNYKHIHFAGPYQQTNFRPKITKLLKLAKSLDVTTSMDPQWDATEKWEYMKEWLKHLTWIFVNQDEAKSITGIKNPKKACHKLAELTNCPVVKLGKDGAMGYVNRKFETGEPFKVKVKDTTGAGDNFAAGFLFATLEKEMRMKDALRFGNAVGSRSCAFVGGTGARSTYRDIVKFGFRKR